MKKQVQKTKKEKSATLNPPLCGGAAKPSSPPNPGDVGD